MSGVQEGHGRHEEAVLLHEMSGFEVIPRDWAGAIMTENEEDMTTEGVQKLRESIDIVRLVRRDSDLVAVGATTWKGRCRLCGTDDSLHVSTRGFFHCYGCRKSGTAIDYVMARRGVAFDEAVRMLRPLA